MLKKIIIGVFVGALIGVFITSIFLQEANLKELFLTKITATSIITGFFSSIYAALSKSKLQIFIISILIGIVVFYSKYLITGHDFDPITMGTFTGALLGGTFATIRKFTHSLKVYKRLKKLRRKGFNNYN